MTEPLSTARDQAREAIALSLLDAGLVPTEELALEIVDHVLADPTVDAARVAPSPRTELPRPITDAHPQRVPETPEQNAAAPAGGPVAVIGGPQVHLFAEETGGFLVTECGRYMVGVTQGPWPDTDGQARCAICKERAPAR